MKIKKRMWVRKKSNGEIEISSVKQEEYRTRYSSILEIETKKTQKMSETDWTKCTVTIEVGE